VGSWGNGSFALDLTKHIPVAGQYALRFRPEQGVVHGFKVVALEIGGVVTPSLLQIDRKRQDELLLDITGLD